MKTARRLIIIGSSLVVVAGAAGTIARVRARPAPPGRGAALVAVATVRAFTPRSLATGSIRLLPGALISVGARASGVVESLAVSPGSRITRGAVIARLDSLEPRARLHEAEAQLAELDAALRQSTLDLARVETLALMGGVTGQELLAARTATAEARARRDAAAAAVDLARIQLGYTVIRAPIDGVVASVTTHEGETVAASFNAPTFVTLLDPTRLDCVALVDESDIGHVAVGDSATFTVDAYPGRDFRGFVTRIAPDASVIGGVVDYEVTIQIRGSVRALKPQMTASVAVMGTTRRALVVPTAAVREAPEGAYVWRRRGGTITRTPVRLGARQSDVTEVVDGLAAGDTVLTGAFPDAG